MGAMVIFGGASDLGLEIAKYLYEKQNTVILASSNLINCYSAIQELHNSTKGIKAFAVQCDVTQINDVQNVFTFCQEIDVSVNGVVNCADSSYLSTIEDIDFKIARSLIDINLLGTIHVLNVFLPELKRNEGTFCAITSKASLRGISGESVCCATKWGVRGFLEAARAELVGTKVKVMSIFPGAIDTRSVDDNVDFHNESPDLAFLQPKALAPLIAESIIHAKQYEVSNLTISRI